MIHTDTEVAGQWQLAAGELGVELVWLDGPQAPLPEAGVTVMLCAVGCFALLRERGGDGFPVVVLLDGPTWVKPLYEAGACSVILEPGDRTARSAVLEFWSRYHRA